MPVVMRMGFSLQKGRFFPEGAACKESARFLGKREQRGTKSIEGRGL